MSGDWTSTGRTAPGEPLEFKSQWLRNVTDAAIGFQRSQQKFGSNRTAVDLPDGIVRVRNESGSDRKRYEILGVSGVAIEPDENITSFLNSWMLTGVVPTKASHLGKFVICANPIPKDQIGWAYAFGVCLCQVNAAATPGEALDVKDSDPTQLTSTSSGLVTALYGGDDSNGNHWAVVRFGAGGGGSNCCMVKVTSSTGGGAYGGNLLTGTATGYSSGAFTGMTVGASCIIINDAERANPTASSQPYIDTTSTPQVPGLIVGTDASTGKTIVAVYTASAGC